ncbi:MAG: hypothetical protein LBB89_11475 [Treponema sp.]|jgi:hypothetical protein|nr:hypothetical protein [Treponema sp.]
MSRFFGATVPPGYGGFLPTNNSNTGLSNRYCIHDINCHCYKQSKKKGNTIKFEASSIKEMEEYLNTLPELQGGIKRCRKCISHKHAQMTVTVSQNIILLIVIGIFISGFLRCCTTYNNFLSPADSPPNTVNRPAPIIVIPRDVNRLKNIYQLNSYVIIDELIYLLWNYGNHYVKDYNGDRKINCIDYSMAFREYYGYNAKLIVNRKPKTDFNHMFIGIYIGGKGMLYVEPQGKPGEWGMKQIWGDTYDPKYNKDVTHEY